VPGRPNHWRRACMLLIILGLLPLFFAIFASLLAIKLALAFIGLGGHPGGRTLLDEIVMHQVLGSLFHPRPQTAVYTHVVDTGHAQVLTRQVGLFRHGHILPGNRVQLRGRLRGGSLEIESGYNDTYGAHLAPRGGGWRIAFFVVLFAYAAVGLALLA
jgi:hypothetical protein